MDKAVKAPLTVEYGLFIMAFTPNGGSLVLLRNGHWLDRLKGYGSHGLIERLQIALLGFRRWIVEQGDATDATLTMLAHTQESRGAGDAGSAVRALDFVELGQWLRTARDTLDAAVTKAVMAVIADIRRVQAESAHGSARAPIEVRARPALSPGEPPVLSPGDIGDPRLLLVVDRYQRKLCELDGAVAHSLPSAIACPTVAMGSRFRSRSIPKLGRVRCR